LTLRSWQGPNPLILHIFLLQRLTIPNLGVIVPNMGVQMTKELSLAGALFSDVQQRVLALIFGHPERSFYTNEIVRKADSGTGTPDAATGAVMRQQPRLQQSGLVHIERIGNQKHYRANRASPIFEELRSLMLKTVGLTDPLRGALQPYAKRIRAAFVFGSVAK